MEEKKEDIDSPDKKEQAKEGQFLFSNQAYTIFYICNFKCELGIVFQRCTDTWLYRAAQRSDTDSDGD